MSPGLRVGIDRLPRGQVPTLQRAEAADESLAVRGEGEGGREAVREEAGGVTTRGGPWEVSSSLARPWLPQYDSFIAVFKGQESAVGRVAHWVKRLPRRQKLLL